MQFVEQQSEVNCLNGREAGRYDNEEATRKKRVLTRLFIGLRRSLYAVLISSSKVLNDKIPHCRKKTKDAVENVTLRCNMVGVFAWWR